MMSAMFARNCFLEILLLLWNISLIMCRQTEENGSNIPSTNGVRGATPKSDGNQKSSSNGESSPDYCAEYATRPCSDLPANCLDCNFTSSCIYGTKVNTTCNVVPGAKCRESNKSVIREHRCAYCYQLPTSDYDCALSPNCRSNSRYQTNCTVHQDVLCMGTRVFPKFLTCNYISGYKWSTALILSITLGGFGVDRFYLGNWQEGIGKLFSFGGLGVWTLVDIILIATGYLKPADGSRYM